jgi:hypothetical protein
MIPSNSDKQKTFIFKVTDEKSRIQIQIRSHFLFTTYQQHQRYRWQNLPPVLLTPVVHLDLRKIRNEPNVIFGGLGEDGS